MTWTAVQLQTQDDWATAAARLAISDRLTLALATQAAFSNLCAGQPQRAAGILEAVPFEIDWTANPALRWLDTFVKPRLGDAGAARDRWWGSSGRDAAGEALTERDLLQAWAAPVGLADRNPPSFWFPRLPPSLTGLAHTVVRATHQVDAFDLEGAS